MDRKNFIRLAGMGSLIPAWGFRSSGKSEAGLFKDPPAFDPKGWPDEVFSDRLYQGPFTVYTGEDTFQSVGGWSVAMTTTPSDKVLHNFGMGLITYVIDEAGAPKAQGQTLKQSIENLAKIPFGQKLYIRVNWKDMQKKPGVLEPSEAWNLTFEMAAKYNKQIGFRVMLNNPDIPGVSMPAFVADKVKQVPLGTTMEIGWDRGKKILTTPEFADPAFQDAFREFNELLADKYNGHPLIEYMDTYMFGFWGEGHIWPFEDKLPFKNHIEGQQTFGFMFRHQLRNWDKVPLTTNTQPDLNHVGNNWLVEQTLKTHNWLRTDTIFIENPAIDKLSNRPQWAAVAMEAGMSNGKEETLQIYHGQTRTDNQIYHTMDIGSNYYSLWNWQAISAEGILRYYEKYPDAIDQLSKKIGYRIRPSWIWAIEKKGRTGLIFGLANDGISGVPGAIKLTLKTEGGTIVESGYVDPGYPHTDGVRQTLMILPEGVDWAGLRLYAEINVKGQLYPVEWACREKVNDDGSLTLTQTPGM